MLLEFKLKSSQFSAYYRSLLLSYMVPLYAASASMELEINDEESIIKIITHFGLKINI